MSFLISLLRDAGIEPVELDRHVSAVEGSIGAFPRRLAVILEDADHARRVLREAGEL
jgi:Putative prokaryotic signal transducing protein